VAILPKKPKASFVDHWHNSKASVVALLIGSFFVKISSGPTELQNRGDGVELY
jgi:hypothetical protein